jgi:hypothetical protein
MGDRPAFLWIAQRGIAHGDLGNLWGQQLMQSTQLMSAFGVKQTLTRDTIGIGFLSGYTPAADTNQQILIPRNEADLIFELAAARAFDGARRDLHEEAQAFDRGDHVRINMGRDRQG